MDKAFFTIESYFISLFFTVFCIWYLSLTLRKLSLLYSCNILLASISSISHRLQSVMMPYRFNEIN